MIPDLVVLITADSRSRRRVRVLVCSARSVPVHVPADYPIVEG